MFLKIYKHSFLASFRTIFPLLIIQPILGIIGGVLSKLADVFKENLHLASVFASVSSILVFAISIMAFAEVIMALSAFKKAVATDEAYLTYTLPATAGQQLGARTLTIATWFAISSVVAFISFTLYSALAGTTPVGDMNINVSEWNGERGLIVFEVILFIITLEISVLFHAVFGVLFAQKLSTKTKTRSANVMTGMLGFGEVVLILILFINLVVSLATSNSPQIAEYGTHIFLWVMIAVFAITGGLCYFLSYKFMSRWLNLE